MVDSNGARGFVGLPDDPDQRSFVSLYPIETVMDKPQYLGLVLFGSDGGGEGYFFDRGTKTIIERPRIGGEEYAREVGSTFDEFLRYLARGGPSRYPESLAPES